MNARRAPAPAAHVPPPQTSIANNWADLIDGTLDAAVLNQANGMTRPIGSCWTNGGHRGRSREMLQLDVDLHGAVGLARAAQPDR